MPTPMVNNNRIRKINIIKPSNNSNDEVTHKFALIIFVSMFILGFILTK